jgi:CHAT domain-containing protein
LVSRSEYQGGERKFRRIDADGDGYLGEAEFEARWSATGQARERAGGPGGAPTPVAQRAALSPLFTPPPRTIRDIEEILAAPLKHRPERLTRLLEMATAPMPGFSRIVVSPKGLTASQVILRLDKDGDRRVSASELGRSARRFEQWDSDHDGSLGAAELEAAWLSRPGHGYEPESSAKGLRHMERALFLSGRGEARWGLGQLMAALEDARAAVAHLERSPNATAHEHNQIRGQLARMESRVGSYTVALEQRARAHEISATVRSYRWLVRSHALLGDIETAQRLMAEGLAEIRRRRHTRRALDEKQSRVYGNSMRIGVLHATGRWAEAEPLIREKLEITTEKGWPRQGMKPMGFASLAEQVQNLLQQDRLLEAELVARRTLVAIIRKIGRDSINCSAWLGVLARVLMAQGRAVEAETLLGAAVQIDQRIGVPSDSVRIGRLSFDLGVVAALRGDWADAAERFIGTRDALGANRPLFDVWITHNADVPVAFAKSGRIAEAYAILSEGYARDRELLGPEHYRTAEKQAALAMTLAAQGEERAALVAYREAMPLLISAWGTPRDELGTETAREQRLAVLLEDYLRLLERTRSSTPDDADALVAEMFTNASVMQSRAVQSDVIASATRATGLDPELAALVRREQDHAKRVDAALGALANVLNAPPGDIDKRRARELRRRIEALRTQHGALAEEIARRFPAYTELVRPRPPSVARVRALLRPGEALVATYVVEDRTYAWAIPRSGKVAFAAASLGATQMAAVVERLRSALDPQAGELQYIPVFEVDTSYQLYAQLLQPLTQGWRSAHTLLVVSHGPLGQLPLSLLVTEPGSVVASEQLPFAGYRKVPWLARSHAIAVLPSVASLAAMRMHRAPSAARRPYLGIGDPIFSVQQLGAVATAGELASRGVAVAATLPVSLRLGPATRGYARAGLDALQRLPETGEEVREIAAALNADPSRDVLTGARATEAALMSLDLHDYKVIVFATHGLVPGDLDGLSQPALAMTSPQVAGTRGDGLLTMAEIMALRLDADWVVLSACNTAAADGAGAEAFSGLGRAFFYAGARAMLLSNWPVESLSARRLTTDLFRRQREAPGLGRAQALRQAMLALIDGPGYLDAASGREAFSYAHPIFWAPFSVVGDGGAAGVVR